MKRLEVELDDETYARLQKAAASGDTGSPSALAQAIVEQSFATDPLADWSEADIARFVREGLESGDAGPLNVDDFLASMRSKFPKSA